MSRSFEVLGVFFFSLIVSATILLIFLQGVEAVIPPFLIASALIAVVYGYDYIQEKKRKENERKLEKLIQEG